MQHWTTVLPLIDAARTHEVMPLLKLEYTQGKPLLRILPQLTL